MTIAITPFDGLCGFRPLNEISHFLSSVSPFRKLVGDSTAKAFQDTVLVGKSTEENKKALQSAFASLMKNEKATVVTAAQELVGLAEKEGENFAGGGGPANAGGELAKLIQRLNSQFEGDIGLFVLFFLNYVKLEVGEAMFLRADDIHAYLSGGQSLFFHMFHCRFTDLSLTDIIECMAASDNVVRAGFTPKFQDIPTLTSMLTYNYAPISEQKMNSVDYPYVTLNTTAYSSSSSSILYDPPIEEFSVVRTELKEAGAKATFEALQGPSIIICTSGSGKISVGPKTEDVKEGFVYFVGATAECVLESEDDNFTTFKAFCELDVKEGANGTT